MTSFQSLLFFCFFTYKNTGSPRYSRTFYLRIRLFLFEKWPKMTLFQSKMDFLSANSRFEVQNDETYLPRITRETCMVTQDFEGKLRYPVLAQTWWVWQSCKLFTLSLSHHLYLLTFFSLSHSPSVSHSPSLSLPLTTTMFSLSLETDTPYLCICPDFNILYFCIWFVTSMHQMTSAWLNLTSKQIFPTTWCDVINFLFWQ